MNFNSIHTERKKILNKNKNKDHVIVIGSNKVLISAPHGVSQVRLGKYKACEIGSLATALYLQQETDSYAIVKAKNNNDDANFDEQSSYKTSIEKLIEEQGITFVIDLHGLAAKRDCDVNLGIHLGNNIKTNEALFHNLYDALVANNFIVKIDQPFMAGSQTIAGSIANKFPHVWTLQIEINCSITNKVENFARYKKLLKMLTDWIKSMRCLWKDGRELERKQILTNC